MSYELVKLGNLCEVLDGRRKPITKRDRIEGNFPYYGATGIVDYVGDFIFDEKLVLIGEDGAKWDSGEKTAFIADGKYWVNNHAHVIKPNRKLLIDEWIVYYFYFKDLKEFVTGLTVPKLNQGQLKIIPIPLPPLPTQQKIVAKLDAIFAEIDKAQVAAEANTKNTEALFQSYLTEVFERGGEDWEILTIKDIIKIRSGDFLPARNMNKDGFIDVYGGNGLSGKHNKHNLSGANIIIGRVGAKCGNVRFVEGDVWITDNAFYVSDYKKDINKEFIALVLELKDLRKLANQMAQPVISFTSIKDAELKIPVSLDKQVELLQVKNTIENQIQVIKNSYANKIEQLKSLKQSILQQAFSGELVKD